MTKNIIIIDFESTCWESKKLQKQNMMEIIEFGCVRLDSKYNIIDQFQKFVCPDICPKLSKFCINLTTITQEDVDNALGFCNILNLFKIWVGDYTEFIFASWGNFDRKILIENCIYHRQVYPFNNDHINIKSEFSKTLNMESVGLGKALNVLQINRIGTAHRGIDDAISAANVYKKLKNEWRKYKVDPRKGF